MVNNLRMMRESCGLSQKELGKILNTSQQSIHLYEQGKTQPSLDTLKKMAEYFNTSVDYLIGETSIAIKYDGLQRKNLSKEESIVMEEYRKLNDDAKHAINITIEALSKNSR